MFHLYRHVNSKIVLAHVLSVCFLRSGSCPSQLLQVQPTDNTHRIFTSASQRIKHKERPSVLNTHARFVALYTNFFLMLSLCFCIMFLLMLLFLYCFLLFCFASKIFLSILQNFTII